MVEARSMLDTTNNLPNMAADGEVLMCVRCSSCAKSSRDQHHIPDSTSGNIAARGQDPSSQNEIFVLRLRIGGRQSVLERAHGSITVKMVHQKALSS